jgi:hypothetical protein
LNVELDALLIQHTMVEVLEKDVDETIEYRVRFRASNKGSSDHLGLTVYTTAGGERVFAPPFFVALLNDLHGKGTIVHPNLKPSMEMMRNWYRK